MQFHGALSFHAMHKGTKLAYASDKDEAVIKIDQWTGDVMVHDQNVANQYNEEPNFSGTGDVDAKPGEVKASGTLTPTEDDLNSLGLSVQEWGGGFGVGWNAQTHTLAENCALNWTIIVQVKTITRDGKRLIIPAWPTKANGDPDGQQLSEYLSTHPPSAWSGDLPNTIQTDPPTGNLLPANWQ